MATKQKTPKRGLHAASDSDIQNIKEKLVEYDAIGEYKWIPEASLGFSQSWIAEEKKKDKKKMTA